MSKNDKHTGSDYFISYLQLLTRELEWDFPGIGCLLPDQTGYLINPRRLRGSDFLMRWEQGRWSEEIVLKALNRTTQFGILPYGPSTIAPDDPQELEIFFETMDVIAQEGKRPDLLLYSRFDYEWATRELVKRLGSVEAMAETASSQVSDIISKAKAAFEIENSLWVTEKMPGFGKPFTRFTRGKNKGRLKPAGIIPTIIVKNEDIPRLKAWETEYNIPIYIVHIFYDRGYFIKFSEVLRLLDDGELAFETQKFTNPDGTASTAKQIVKVPYILCRPFGSVSGPTMRPRTFVDKNGKVMTYVTFDGGEIDLSPEVFEAWGS